MNDDWPGADRREPRVGDRFYLARVGLARALRLAFAELGPGPLDVVDVGCGTKPYLPWLRSCAGSYLGVDAYPGPYVDRVSPAERLDFLAAGSVDLVLSTQTLEHVESPARVVAEARRVLRPGGVALLSTHGVFPFHGQPQDFWRWTHLGLKRLFEEAGFESVEVRPTDGIASAVLGLVDFYAYSLGDRLPVFRFLRYTVHPLLGLVAPRLDRYAGWLFETSPLSINYLVVARTPRP